MSCGLQDMPGNEDMSSPSGSGKGGGGGEEKRGYIFKAVSTSLSAFEGKSALHSRTHCKQPRGTNGTDRGWSSGSFHLKPRLRQGLPGITGSTNSTSIEASE